MENVTVFIDEETLTTEELESIDKIEGSEQENE